MKINSYRYVFFDFDGVIADSLEAKSQAFRILFSNIEQGILERIAEHHLDNGGISRYQKIPLYMEWAGIKNDEVIINEYISQYENTVFDLVVRSSLVSGVKDYLLKNKYQQEFILVTATPHNEILKILEYLEINKYFSSIYGFPNKKEYAIREFISTNQCLAQDCLMIGDSITDIEAANKSEIDFLLRRHKFNKNIILSNGQNEIEDFINL